MGNIHPAAVLLSIAMAFMAVFSFLSFQTAAQLVSHSADQIQAGTIGGVLTINGTTLRVGIGAGDPQAKLDVRGEIWAWNTGGNTRVVIGEGYSANQYGALGWNAAGDYLWLDASSAAGQARSLVLQSGNENNGIGNVGIGKVPASGTELDVSGDIAASGSVTGARLCIGSSCQSSWPTGFACSDLSGCTLSDTFCQKVTGHACGTDTSARTLCGDDEFLAGDDLTECWRAEDIVEEGGGITSYTDTNAKTLCGDGQFLAGNATTWCRTAAQIVADGGGGGSGGFACSDVYGCTSPTNTFCNAITGHNCGTDVSSMTYCDGPSPLFLNSAGQCRTAAQIVADGGGGGSATTLLWTTHKLDPLKMQHRLGIATGYDHTCILKLNGNVFCQGKNDYGQSAGYTGGNAIAVSTGFYHTCVLTSGGDVDCQGSNSDGRATDRYFHDAIAVAAGAYHTCILRSNGNVYCQGSNDYGQSNAYNGGDAIGVSAGYFHTCMLKSNGNVYCQGSSSDGMSNAYNGGDAIGVATGYEHTCILKTNGNVVCQGDNDYGQSNAYNGGDAIGVSAGYFHTCILKSNGNVYCQGRNDWIYAGQANAYNGGDAIGVTAGHYHTCILKPNGNVYCQGSNSDGRANAYNGGDAKNPFNSLWELS